MDPQNVPHENVHPDAPPVKPKKTKLLLLLFLPLLILLIGGTYLISQHFRLPGESLLGTNTSLPTQPPTTAPTSTGIVPKWKTPQNYLAVDHVGNIVLGSLKGGRAKIAVKAIPGSFGSPQFQAISKSGKYFLYTKLPDATITELQKNPPYEFHGSNEYELHLVTIGENNSVKDELVDTGVAIFLRSSTFAFDKDGRGFYYPKYENEKDVVYYFNFASASKKATPLPPYLSTNAALSPSGSRYVLLEALPKEQSDTSVNDTYNLTLYTLGNTKEKILYANFTSGDNSLLFPTEHDVYLAREDYVDGPNSICYIEKITVPGGKVTPLRAQECPPGFSNTNYHDLSLSPDGKLLLAEYTQEGPGDQNTKLSNFFLYDLESDASQTIAEIDNHYGDYFWVDNREVVVSVPPLNTSGKTVTYRVNLMTGEATTDESFGNNRLLGVY